MPLNAAVSMGMVTLGISVGVLGKWGAHRVADFLSDSNLYERRVRAHTGWSEDRNFRLYLQAMGSFPPFDSRILPDWLDVDRQQVYNLRQYKNTDWVSPPPPNQYYYQNRSRREHYQLYDAAGSPEAYNAACAQLALPPHDRFSDPGTEDFLGTKFQQAEQLLAQLTAP